VPFLPRLGLALSCAALLTALAGGSGLAAPDEARERERRASAEASVEPVRASAKIERGLVHEQRQELRRGERIAATAMKYLGYPYAWGGRSPETGFDCSGFTMFVYGTLGLDLPRDLGGQLESGRPISRDELIPGDLLIFQNTYKRGISHSAVYIGDGQFVHANDERTGVLVSTFGNHYWEVRFYGASRPGR
jgi:cell wall-associated NlpC family hydrolase